MIALGTLARNTIIALGIAGLVGAVAANSVADESKTPASKPAAAAAASPSKLNARTALAPISSRFADDTHETPSFERHVVPLLGKLGCNGRACHGSFQGRGGFRLSLFGYDFKMDHDALMANEDGARVDLKNPDASLILQKPTLRIDHEGGKRYALGSWEHHVLLRWIQSGAAGVKPSDAHLVRLEVKPAEIRFAKKGEHVDLRTIAHWSDGSSEDVTPLCRYQSNDEQIAKIDASGHVTSGEPGDSHVVAFYDSGVTPVPVMQPVSDLVGPRYPDVPTPTEIDRLVVKKLRKVGIVPSELCDDGEFLRRVSLDLTGTLPSADEVVAFLGDKSPDKRHKKIDELLERPTYVAWWTTRLCDLTGNTDRALANITPVNTRIASEEWYDWILKRVRANVPYDKLVEGIVLATSRPQGQTYTEYSNEMTGLYRKTPEGNYADHAGLTHFWARRNIQQPQQKALAFAYTFLGIRIQCAECHKHPFDQWTQEDYKDFTKFFARVRYGTDPSDGAQRKQLTDALGISPKQKIVDIRREYPRLIAEGKIIPFDELFITPLRVRAPLRAQRPGALKRAKVAAKAANKVKPVADASNAGQTTNPTGGQSASATRKSPPSGTKPIVAQRDEKKTVSGKVAKADPKTPGTKPPATKSPGTKPTARKPLMAMRPGQKRPVAKGGRPALPDLATAKLLGAGNVDLTQYDDPRVPLMNWLRAKNNRFFARAFVNRVWANYFNVGIVNPPDDLSLANPASNAELLDYLAKGFVQHNYDMKWLHREIANSRTYQLSWRPNATNKLDQRNFSHAVVRRLPAEVAYDAVRQATSSDKVARTMRTECNDRAIGIAGTTRRGGRFISPYALGLFGRSVRETNCDCDRSNEPSLLQTVFLRNDSEVLAMVGNPQFGWISQITSELAPKPARPAGVKKPAAKKPAEKAAATSAAGKAAADHVANASLAAKSDAKPNTQSKAVAKKEAAKPTARKQDFLTPEQKARQIAQLTDRIRKSKEAGKEEQVKQFTARLEEIKRLPVRARPAAPLPVLKPSSIPTATKQELVRRLYLRALSRFPEPQEFDRALAYLDNSNNFYLGMRDLVWAVVNTEEFIVNH
jgi:hypothetical protein